MFVDDRRGDAEGFQRAERRAQGATTDRCLLFLSHLNFPSTGMLRSRRPRESGPSEGGLRGAEAEEGLQDLRGGVLR